MLLLMAFDQSGKVFNASVCRDNCAKWILSIGESKDLTINLRYIMDLVADILAGKEICGTLLDERIKDII